jgi:hypothetical protein
MKEGPEGLGSDFLAAVDETTPRIEQFPEAGPSTEQTSAGDSSAVSLSRSSTKYNLIESSLPQ